MTTATPEWVAKNRRASYNAMPGSPWTAAFQLSQEQARDLVVSYVLNGLLTLEKPVTFGADGAPTYPKIGERSKLKLDNIGGVRFIPDSKAAATWTFTGSMDLRTAVLAVRLATYLRESKWRVSTIFWGGMGVGRSDDDRHGKGYAIDFHGAITTVGKLDVAAHWGQQPITLPDGKTARQWPANIQPYFRLDVDTPAGGFFKTVYHFLAGEAVDNGSTNESSIGDRSRILHPDTPDVGQRPSHQDHIHCDIDR
jgi:hypothetical protein